MIKHFYSYHVEIDSLIIEIDSLDIEKHEKKHLISLAESHIHNSILATIMSELKKRDKETFLAYLNSRDHEKTWKFLDNRVKNIEGKIQATAAAIKKELLSDVRKLREKK